MPRSKKRNKSKSAKSYSPRTVDAVIRETSSAFPGSRTDAERKKDNFLAILFILGMIVFSIFAGFLTWSFLLSIHVANIPAIIIGVIVGVLAVPIVKSAASGAGSMF